MNEIEKAMAQSNLQILTHPYTRPLVGAMQTGPDADAGARVGKKEIDEATQTLTEYKQGKANLEARIVEDELWYKLRHWQAVSRSQRTIDACRKAGLDMQLKPSSAWLFNAILNKHADAMDNIPTAVVLPREPSDEQSAKALSAVLPVVMELNSFEQVYSAGWWEKLKHGTAAYGVFWDSGKDNGLGDIAIKEIDLLRIFWEPGITDIQKSSNLFITDLVDTDLLEQQYPQYKGELSGNVVDLTQYVFDDAVDTSRKSLVVDWYYKRQNPSGQTVVHYAKFVGECLLYASENEPEYAARGYYDHGLYPVVLDTMFPEEGTPVGWGYVALCKDPQLYIDRLSGNLLEYADEASRSRWFISSSTAINEEQFSDPTQRLIRVEGTLDDTKTRQITMAPPPGFALDLIQLKTEEMKETSANRDVNAGGAGGGVTAASAIAALQEAGNKVSRDMIAASYRAHTEICKLCIELMRQFYDEARTFRVTGTTGAYEFVAFSNAQIQQQPMGVDAQGQELYRLPVFDLKVSAQKKNPFSRMEENERAKELYGMGFFDPSRAQEAMNALDMMDFEGIDKVRERVQQGQTLYNLVQQQAALIAQLTGAMPDGSAPAQRGNSYITASGAGQSVSSEIMQAHTPMTGYGQRLAQRSTPSMEAQG